MHAEPNCLHIAGLAAGINNNNNERVRQAFRHVLLVQRVTCLALAQCHIGSQCNPSNNNQQPGVGRGSIQAGGYKPCWSLPQAVKIHQARQSGSR